jgi:hypothetical protein
MSVQPDLQLKGRILRTDRRERTPLARAFTDPDAPGAGLGSEVVGISAQSDPRGGCEIPTLVNGDDGVAPLGHEELLDRGREEDTLRLVKPSDLRHAAIPRQVDHLDGAMLERRNEQTVPGRVHGEVIHATLDAGEEDPGDLAKRSRLSDGGSGEPERDEEPGPEAREEHPRHGGLGRSA